MKVSQLIRLINKDDEIIILNDEELDIDKARLCRGSVKGIKRDSPLNKYHIVNISAYDDIILVFAVEPKEKGAGNEGGFDFNSASVVRTDSQRQENGGSEKDQAET